MILPIVSYGNKILKNVADEIDKDFEDFDGLLVDMWDTLYATEGVGLAAPQIDEPIRVFVVDASHVIDDYKKVFINPKITEYSEEVVEMSEGCLSLPGLTEMIKRSLGIKITYYDENWEFHEDEYKGDDEKEALIARMLQHEYDHIEGKLYIDRLPQLRKELLKSKLDRIMKGNIYPPYKMTFPKK